MPSKTIPATLLSSLTAISVLDGRYREKLVPLVDYVSEYSLMQNRITVEALYLIALSDQGIVRTLTTRERAYLTGLGKTITIEQAERIKEIEQQTRHDVKAMEYFFRELVKGTSLEDVTEMIHFGLTSEDVNNLAYRLQLKQATDNVLLPALTTLLQELAERAERYKTLPMLARTHGQAAVPTTFGKELAVFATRLHGQVHELRTRKLSGKLNGAVGNFNALYTAYPAINWTAFSEKFLTALGFAPNLITTQINTYEDVTEYLQNMQRINTILIDFDQDIWRYISDGWIVQVAKKGEVGSSTMPQKVNPIDFENSEGNLGLANTLCEYLSRKLPISRLQRDLTDSTTMRNLGSVLGYSFLGYTSILTGLQRIKPDEQQMRSHLQKDWTILAEGVQTLLRTAGISDPYTLLASLTRGEHVGEEQWLSWIDTLPIDPHVREQLRGLTPDTYLGLSIHLTDHALQTIKKN